MVFKSETSIYIRKMWRYQRGYQKRSRNSKGNQYNGQTKKTKRRILVDIMLKLCLKTNTNIHYTTRVGDIDGDFLIICLKVSALLLQCVKKAIRVLSMG